MELEYSVFGGDFYEDCLVIDHAQAEVYECAAAWLSISEWLAQIDKI